MKWLLLLCLVLGPLTPLAGQSERAQPGTITGSVRSLFQTRPQPLAFAVVEAWAPGFRRTALADSLGRYTLTGVPAGHVRVVVSHAGHDATTVDVLVPAAGTAHVDLELRARPVELPALDVRGDRLRVGDPAEREASARPETLTEVEVAALAGGSGLTDPGLVSALRSLGGNEPGQPQDVLFMRGSTTDLKLVLLDGAPVYTPFHVAGLLQSFDPAVLGRADLHVGGAPARFDGGLTSILDLQTRRPNRDRFRGSGSADLLSATLALDGPILPATGLVASLRSLHGLGSVPLGSSPYGYRDALLSVETEPVEGHALRTTAFWNEESVVLDLARAVDVRGAEVPEAASWSNRAVSGSYRGEAGRAFLDVMVAGGAYEATLPLQPWAPASQPRPEALLASAGNERLRAGAEVAVPGDRGVFRAGLSFEDLDAAYSAGPLGSGHTSVSTAASARTAGGYLDVTRQIAPEVTLRGGLRVDHLSGIGGGLRLAPRAAVSWAFAPQALLTVAAGRYHQHARASDTEVERALADVVDGAEGGPALLPVATADHVVVSLDQRMGAATVLGIEGFWKGYRGLRPDPEEVIRSSGVDLRVMRRGDRATAWVGYGLTWFWSQTDLSGGGGDFTGRHLLTTGVSGRVMGRFGGEVRMAYGAGLPYTSVPFPTSGSPASEDFRGTTETLEERTPPLAGGLDESFLRLDLELHARFTPVVAGHRWEVRPYVRVLNALDRRDALFYAFQPWRGEELMPLAERPVVPVVGVSWRF